MILEVLNTKERTKRFIEINDLPNDAVWLEQTESLGAETQFRITGNPEGAEVIEKQTWKQFLDLYYFEFLFERAFNKPSAQGFVKWVEQNEERLFH